jgi:peptidoglycan/xylan/chitin deacetylase (PgdA/CDA1 family)
VAEGRQTLEELPETLLGKGDGIRKTIVELPARLGLTRLWRGLRPGGTPVLALHGVLPGHEARHFNATGKFVTPDKLRAFLERLGRLYEPASLDELTAALLEGRALKNKYVLSFDDGYANLYTDAFPLLQDMGVPFAVFVTTGMIDTDTLLWNDLLEFAVFSTRKKVLPAGILDTPVGLEPPALRQATVMRLKAELKKRPIEEARSEVERLCAALDVAADAPELAGVRFLTTVQIREMAAAGVLFGGHTVSHPILSRETQDRVRTEVTECKQQLESATGRPVTVFAYPNGQVEDFNEMVKAEVAEAGYRSAVTGIAGLAYPGADPFEIKRILVDCRWTCEELETRASGILEVLGR